MLQVEALSGGYDERTIIKNVSFQVEKGQILGILGPNGSGKSTLLKMVTGVLKKQQGRILIDGKPMEQFAGKALAKKMAVLPQLHANAFSNTVRETVALGRYPHQSGFFSSWIAADEQAIEQAMAQTGVTQYAQATMQFLSGGEQQRVFIAQALAQQAEILLLDEPTNHLDITHQKQILDMLRAEATERGLTVVSIFHDINLASLYCDQLLLMDKGEVKYIGAPHEVVQKKQVEQIYEANVATYAHPEIAKPQMMILPSITQKSFSVHLTDVHVTPQYIQLQSAQPLKVISSAVYNAGMGWYTTLLNRTVPLDYNVDNVEVETAQFLAAQQFSPTNSVVMLTAVSTSHVAMSEYAFDNHSVMIIVTAGVGHAVDVTKTYARETVPTVGTINTWIVVNGKLTDEAFYQAMITATEAKTKALYDAGVKDTQSNTYATGTATDSLLVAGTQYGNVIAYAGPITPLGKTIGKGVYDMTREAIEKTRSEA